MVPEVLRRALVLLTCFHASFFPFCPLCWSPLFLPFLGTFFALFSPQKLLCSVEQGAQHRAWKGAVSVSTSAQISGRKFLPEICVKKGQFMSPKTREQSQGPHTQSLAAPWGPNLVVIRTSEDCSRASTRKICPKQGPRKSHEKVTKKARTLFF